MQSGVFVVEAGIKCVKKWFIKWNIALKQLEQVFEKSYLARLCILI